MRKIGIVGGTFNPIHLGHLMLAEWALDELQLDEIWLIPTGVSYMKNPNEIASGIDRFRMAELAAADNDRFKCLDTEVYQTDNTYSYRTLEILHGKYPEDDFYFILGADCLYSIEKWKNPDIIFRQCTIVAAVRNNTEISDMKEKRMALEKKYHGKIILLPFIRMSLSSTEIRQRIRNGQSIRYLVPDKVLSYIEEKGLYREKNC